MNILVIDLLHEKFKHCGKIKGRKGKDYIVDIEGTEYILNPKEFIKEESHKDKIPSGCYCYFGTRAPSDNNNKNCTYWSIDSREIGFCSLLGISDEDEGVLALFDQVKECGINED